MITPESGQQQAHRLIQVQNMLTWDKNKHTNLICFRPSKKHDKRSKRRPGHKSTLPESFPLDPLGVLFSPPNQSSTLPHLSHTVDVAKPHVQLSLTSLGPSKAEGTSMSGHLQYLRRRTQTEDERRFKMPPSISHSFHRGRTVKSHVQHPPS